MTFQSAPSLGRRRAWPAWARAMIAILAGAGSALILARLWRAPDSSLRYATLYSVAFFITGAVRYWLIAETAAMWRSRTAWLLCESFGIGLLLWWALRR